MKEFVEFLAKHIVDNPDKVIVEETTSDEHNIELTLKVDQSDIGKIIGKKGKNIIAAEVFNLGEHIPDAQFSYFSRFYLPRLQTIKIKIELYNFPTYSLKSIFYLMLIDSPGIEQNTPTTTSPKHFCSKSAISQACINKLLGFFVYNRWI